MASQVNASIPADNVAPDKAEIRQNFRITRDEITDLQRKTRKAWSIAMGKESV